MDKNKIFRVIQALHSSLGMLLVPLFVVVALSGMLLPRVDFQEPLMKDLELGYAVLDEEFNHYIMPTTTGGFIYDTKVGFVYIDAIGRYIQESSESHPGKAVRLVEIKDTLLSLDFEGQVQEKARLYHISMYLNVLLALLLIVIFDYYNLVVKVRASKPLCSRIKLFSKPVQFSSSAIIIVAAIFLLLNLGMNGKLDFGKQALVETSVYYMPYDQGSYKVDTPLGFLEFGNGEVYLEDEKVPIMRSMYVYDGYLVHSINPTHPEDRVVNVLRGLILIFTALYLVNKLAQFSVKNAGKDNKKGGAMDE